MNDRRQFDQEHTITLVRGGTSRGRVLSHGDIVGGDHRLKTLIGQGGMGYVFRAEHIMMGRDYALKMMAPEHFNEINLRRFESEGRAIAALDHANIVKVYNMGVDGGDCPYIVMDLLDGQPLSYVVRRSGRKLKLPEILDIIIQAARGLDYAHGRGIVHRDIKPSNLMLVKDGTGKTLVRIVDFGLAKLVKDQGGASQRLTGTGHVAGSPYYMSPEQCVGTDIDARSDIYSLGVTLYEAVMGEPPYIGKNPLETVMMHSSKPVPDFYGVFDDEHTERRMNMLLSRMMAKRREDRYQTMSQVVHDLERISHNKDIGRANATMTNATMINASMPGANRLPAAVRYRDEEQPEAAPDNAAWKRSALIVGCVGVTLAIAGISALFLPQFMASKKSHVQQQAAVDTVESDLKKRGNEDAIFGSGVTALGEAGRGGYSWVYGRSDYPAVTKMLQHFGAITSKKKGREILIHFPSYCVGKVSINDNTERAQDDLILPASGHLGLEIDWCGHPLTLPTPQIFEKIDKDLFEYLCVKSIAVAVGKDGVRDVQIPALKKILGWASNWTKLYKLKLEDFSTVDGDDSVFDCIDRLPHLQSVIFASTIVDLGHLSKHPFVQRVNTLDIESTQMDLKPIMPVLVASTKLETLTINSTKTSAETLSLLARSPSLKSMYVSSGAFKTDQLAAIAKVPKLRLLQLSRLKPSQADLLALSKVPPGCTVFLYDVDHSTTDVADWTRICPNLKVQ